MGVCSAGRTRASRCVHHGSWPRDENISMISAKRFDVIKIKCILCARRSIPWTKINVIYSVRTHRCCSRPSSLSLSLSPSVYLTRPPLSCFSIPGPPASRPDLCLPSSASSLFTTLLTAIFLFVCLRFVLPIDHAHVADNVCASSMCLDVLTESRCYISIGFVQFMGKILNRIF